MPMMTTATADQTRASVLIADDDPVAMLMLKLLLESKGYQLGFADTGHEALRQAHAMRPDLVLLDVRMPDLDGYEVCRRLRADPILADVPVIMLTALTDREARIRGIEAGADDFVSKPFDQIELAARVRTITRLNRYRRVQEAEQLKRQIDTAATIQQLLLPSVAPAVPGMDIVGRYRPAARIGGDYYDFIVRGTSFYFVVADVSGHGLASALFMASARSALRALLPSTPDVLGLAEGVNALIVQDAGDSGMFMTAVLGCYDTRDHSLAVVNCGHPEPVVQRADGSSESIPASSCPIGVQDRLDADRDVSTLEAGDLVCLCTDGLIEAANPAGDLFGMTRFRSALAGLATASPEQIADAMLETIAVFTGRNTFEDDFTLVLLRRHPTTYA